MELQTVLFIGPSGCGKGTQAKLLKEYLEKNDTNHPVHYFQTGEKFRNFAKSDNYTAKKVADVLEKGGLQPGFMPIWIWSSLFIEGVTGDEHIIADGFPRRAEESPILHTALEFYERPRPAVISFEVPDDILVERLVEGRKRADDTEENVRKRLAWFKRDASLAVKFFEEHSYYRVLHVDGNQSVEKVHDDILSFLTI
jgi:adenylate kinase